MSLCKAAEVATVKFTLLILPCIYMGWNRGFSFFDCQFCPRNSA